MDTLTLTRHFERIGARLVVRPLDPPRRRWNGVEVISPSDYRLDVIRDRRGEAFELRAGAQADLTVLNTVPTDRHLLLLARRDDDKERFLCGHDERHWFAATIREAVSTVREAKASLMPDALRPRRLGQITREDQRRHTARFIRQGEWFFVPAFDDAQLTALLNAAAWRKIVHYREPITRGRGKPHIVDEVIRVGGRTVRLFKGRELSEGEFLLMQAERPKIAAAMRTMTADAAVYARGHVRHPDHATIYLPDWHRVHMNTEGGSANMVFYD